MIATALLLASATCAAAQEVEELTTDQVKVVTYQPQAIGLEELYEAAQNLAGRTYSLGDRYVENLSLLYDRILLYDTEEQVTRILDLLRALEGDFAHGPSDRPKRMADYPTREYRLRALGPADAIGLLSGYVRSIEVSEDDESWTSFLTVTEVGGGGLLLRDTTENLEAMVGLLESLDRPAPQVLLRAWILRGPGDLEPGERPLPAALEKNLQAMLPGVPLEEDAQGALRAAAQSHGGVELHLTGRSGVRYDLEVRISAYDQSNGVLSLESCQLRADEEDLFTTGTTIASQEYAVIGISGGAPTLLVLQMQPIAR